MKHILQKPVVNLRKSYSNSVQELRRYASFIATSNQKDLLTDPSGSRRFMCVEVTGTIDTARPIDYEQLYAQAMYEICHGERYWLSLIHIYMQSRNLLQWQISIERWKIVRFLENWGVKNRIKA